MQHLGPPPALRNSDTSTGTGSKPRAASWAASAIAWAGFNGNTHIFGGNVIHLAVTPGLIWEGALFAALLAFVGGIFPALRAARRPRTAPVSLPRGPAAVGPPDGCCAS